MYDKKIIKKKEKKDNTILIHPSSSLLKKNYSILSYLLDTYNNIGKIDITKNHNTKDIIQNKYIKSIIVIGDIHGDYECLLNCLQKGNIIDSDITYNSKIEDINWCIHTKNVAVVQIGDIVDMKCRYKINDVTDIKERGDNLKIFRLLYKLQYQSANYKSKFICLFGNHEIDNVVGNFKYTSDKEFHEFYKEYGTDFDKDTTILGYNARKKIFSRGNILARHLSHNFLAIVVVQNWLFVHAGISMEIVKKYTIKDINSIFKNWLLSSDDNHYYNNDIELLYNNRNSILKTRILCNLKDSSKNHLEYFMSLIHEINKKNNINIDGIIIGHTPQINQGINSSFENKLWRIDTGMSRAFNDNNRIQLLLIHTMHTNINNNDRFKII